MPNLSQMCSIGFKVGSKLGMGIDCALSLSAQLGHLKGQGRVWCSGEKLCGVACCMGSGVVMLKDSASGSQEWDGVCLCS